MVDRGRACRPPSVADHPATTYRIVLCDSVA